jgi:hypothetical protein
MTIRSLFLAALFAVAALPAQAADHRPDRRLPFPAIKDWKTLKITLERGACFGSCPSYTVEIDGDGTVTFNGNGFVASGGEHKSRLPLADVRALVAAFHSADFFWTFDRYDARVMDIPTSAISIAFDGREKDISERDGLMAGMPQAIVDLETLIDKTANTRQWILDASGHHPMRHRSG